MTSKRPQSTLTFQASMEVYAVTPGDKMDVPPEQRITIR